MPAQLDIVMASLKAISRRIKAIEDVYRKEPNARQDQIPSAAGVGLLPQPPSRPDQQHIPNKATVA